MATTIKKDDTIIPPTVEVPCVSETYPSADICGSYAHRYFAVKDDMTEKTTLMPVCSHHYGVLVAKHGATAVTKDPKSINAGFKKFMQLPLWKQRELLNLVEPEGNA